MLACSRGGWLLVRLAATLFVCAAFGCCVEQLTSWQLELEVAGGGGRVTVKHSLVSGPVLRKLAGMQCCKGCLQKTLDAAARNSIVRDCRAIVFAFITAIVL